MGVRPAQGAGLLYPRDGAALAGMINDCIDAVESVPREEPPGRLKALLVPHAGIAWCGRLKALGFREVPPGVTRVVLLGSAHEVPVEGIAACAATGWATPLGTVPTVGLVELAGLPGVAVDEAAFARDSSLDSQLAWLQNRVEHLQVLPLLVGAATPDQLRALLERFWEDERVLVVVCANLARQLPRAVAEQRDAATLAAVARGEVIGEDGCCAASTVSAVATLAAGRGLTSRVLGSSTTADVSGRERDVTGFGVVAWYQ